MCRVIHAAEMGFISSLAEAMSLSRLYNLPITILVTQLGHLATSPLHLCDAPPSA